MGDTQENSHPTEVTALWWGGGPLREVTRKSTVNKGKVVSQIKVGTFSIDEFLGI